MNNSDAADVDRAAIMETTAELLAAVNASDADRCLAVWTPDGVLMPPTIRRCRATRPLPVLPQPLLARQIQVYIYLFSYLPCR